jgi:hypothetical protein
MNRLRFLESNNAGEEKLRLRAYLLPPRRRVDKALGRVIAVLFAVKMAAPIALACDEKIRNAWEQCEDFAREISAVEIDSIVENTNIDFFELMESKRRVFAVRNATIERLLMRRKDGQTTFYFQFDVPLKLSRRIGAFTDHYFGTDVFCEFAKASLIEEQS